MEFIICGDLVPTESNKNYFLSADTDNLLGYELKNILSNADYRIFNIETPLVDTQHPIEKNGPNLFTPIDCINGIKALNPDLVTLANNHILDQGEIGINSTFRILSEYGIKYLGAGCNLKNAAKPHIVTVKNKVRIGIYACAEYEFSIATENSPGANPFNPLESLDHISNLKKQCDYIIVLYHGGKEHYRYPSPLLQKSCRKMIEKGATLVICQHTHCIGCEEKYKNGVIIYGQGNFLFDIIDEHNINYDYWKNGLIIKFIPDISGYNINYIPICKENNVIRLANDTEKKEIMDAFNSRSEQIKESKFIDEAFKQYSRSLVDHYLTHFNGWVIKKILRVIQILLKKNFINILYTKKDYLLLQNYFQCESHREIIINILSNKNISTH